MENNPEDEFLLEKKEIKPLDGKSLISLRLSKKTGDSQGDSATTYSDINPPVLFTMEPQSFSDTSTNTDSSVTPSFGTRLRRFSHSDRSWSTSRIQIQPRKSSHHTPTLSPAQSPAQSFCNSLNRQANFNSLQESIEYKLGDTIADYKLIKILGSGSTSQVYLATTPVKPAYLPESISSPEYTVALKIVYGNGGNEVTIWKDLHHHSILEMIECITIDTVTIIVSELAEGGSLLELVKKSNGLSKRLYIPLMIMIMEGIEYLHSKSIIHHDIKLENILLTAQCQVKICDFGLSRTSSIPTSTIHASLDRKGGVPAAVGSLHYIPPEELCPNSSHVPTPGLDIWACGCVFYALVMGVLPFNDTFLPRLQMMIVSGKYEDLSDKDISKIIGGMLCPVEKRWNAAKVLMELKVLGTS